MATSRNGYGTESDHRVQASAARLAANRKVRVTIAVAVAVAILAGVNVLLSFGPTGTALVAGPLVAVALVVLARRAGLSWDDLGLSRRAWRRGVGWAAVAVVVVAAVLAIGASLPALRALFLDVRYQLDLGSLLIKVLVILPLGTILLEEVAFRGVLFGLLRHRQGVAWAFGVSSGLFGLWHVLPEIPGGRSLPIAAIVVTTALLGLVLCELRRRSGSLLASVAGHWAANGLGVLLAALLWTWH